MKCPACKYVLSDSNDICGKCLLDLRPYKEEVGITISHPGLEYQEIIDLKFPAKQTKKKKKKSKPDTANKKKNGNIVQSLFNRVFSSSKPSGEAIPLEAHEESDTHSPAKQVYEILNDAHEEARKNPEQSESLLTEEISAVEEAVVQVAPVAEATPVLLQEEAPQAVEESSPQMLEEIIDESEVSSRTGLSEDLELLNPGDNAIAYESPSFSGPEVTALDAEETEKVRAEPETIAEVSKPAVAPKVQEFTDESDDFDDYLNSILGDTEIEIEAVKTKPIDYGIRKEAELPFEFEVEFEDDDEDDDE